MFIITKSRHAAYRLLFCAGALILAACSGSAPAQITVDTDSPAPSGTPGELGALPALPLPTQTQTAVPTPTITPTVTPPHPLSIDYLKQQSYSGELLVEEVLEPEDTYQRFIVSYLSEGNKNYALLTVPLGDPPETGWPVIVFNHGSIPPDVYRTTQGYEKYVHAFAENGYIVLRPDYRGHGNSEGEPRNTYFHPGNTIDVLNAVAAVKKWEGADPQRIGIWGHSMGGWITLRAMIVDPDIRVGVIWAGVIGSYNDLCVYWFNCENWDEQTWTFWSETPFAEFGLPSENKPFWEAASMDTYLSELHSPVQLHHAESDTVVPVALSRVMYEKMLALGIEVEFNQYPGDDHNISQTFDLAMKRSLRFFDIHLKGLQQ